MTHSDLRLRAVKSCVQRTGEFRSKLLNLPGGSSSASYDYLGSTIYGAWELIKLFADVPAIAAEVRTMDGIRSYMASHSKHDFYCKVELWSSLNTVLDLLARQRFEPSEIFGTTEQCNELALKALTRCIGTLEYPHVDFQYARFLLVFAARMLREAEATVPEANVAQIDQFQNVRSPLAAAIRALEKESKETTTAALVNAKSVVAQLTPAPAAN